MITYEKSKDDLFCKEFLFTRPAFFGELIEIKRLQKLINIIQTKCNSIQIEIEEYNSIHEDSVKHFDQSQVQGFHFIGNSLIQILILKLWTLIDDGTSKDKKEKHYTIREIINICYKEIKTNNLIENKKDILINTPSTIFPDAPLYGRFYADLLDDKKAEFVKLVNDFKSDEIQEIIARIETYRHSIAHRPVDLSDVKSIKFDELYKIIYLLDEMAKIVCSLIEDTSIRSELNPLFDKWDNTVFADNIITKIDYHI